MTRHQMDSSGRPLGRRRLCGCCASWTPWLTHMAPCPTCPRTCRCLSEMPSRLHCRKVTLTPIATAGHQVRAVRSVASAWAERGRQGLPCEVRCCLSLNLHCLSLTYRCLFLHLHCLSLTFRRLSLNLHCLSLAFRRHSLNLHCLSLAFHCLSLTLSLPVLTVPRAPRSARKSLALKEAGALLSGSDNQAVTNTHTHGLLRCALCLPCSVCPAPPSLLLCPALCPGCVLRSPVSCPVSRLCPSISCDSSGSSSVPIYLHAVSLVPRHLFETLTCFPAIARRPR